MLASLHQYPHHELALKWYMPWSGPRTPSKRVLAGGGWLDTSSSANSCLSILTNCLLVEGAKNPADAMNVLNDFLVIWYAANIPSKTRQPRASFQEAFSQMFGILTSHHDFGWNHNSKANPLLRLQPASNETNEESGATRTKILAKLDPSPKALKFNRKPEKWLKGRRLQHTVLTPTQAVLCGGSV